MSERNWKLYIEDILEAINFIKAYIRDCTFENFISDRKTEEFPLLEKEFIKIKNERDSDFQSAV